jgi:hypothetical protein
MYFRGHSKFKGGKKVDLYESYLKHANQKGERYRSIETTIGLFLTKNIMGLLQDRVTVKGEEYPVRIYRFPPLKECRSQFEKLLQQKIPWPKEDVGADVNWVHEVTWSQRVHSMVSGA